MENEKKCTVTFDKTAHSLPHLKVTFSKLYSLKLYFDQVYFYEDTQDCPQNKESLFTSPLYHIPVSFKANKNNRWVERCSMRLKTEQNTAGYQVLFYLPIKFFT